MFPWTASSQVNTPAINSIKIGQGPASFFQLIEDRGRNFGNALC